MGRNVVHRCHTVAHDAFHVKHLRADGALTEWRGRQPAFENDYALAAALVGVQKVVNDFSLGGVVKAGIGHRKKNALIHAFQLR